MSEIIVADEITKLEQVVNYLKNLRDQLKNYELYEEEVLSKIDKDEEVRKFFLIEFIEIIRDELRFSKLTDFLDGYGCFGVKYDLSELLDKVVRSLEFRLENLRRGLEWR